MITKVRHLVESPFPARGDAAAHIPEELNFVKSGQMLANCLTKKGASSKSLMAVLRNGEMRDFK